MKRYWLQLTIVLMCVFGVGFLSPGQAAAQDYTCPEQTEYWSATPFTVEMIEAIVGFSDPGLQDLVNIPVYDWRPEPFYFFNLSCTPYNDTTYVGFLYYTHAYVYTHVRVFKIQAGQVVSTAVYDFPPLGWVPDMTSLSGFADRNFNGQPDFFVSGSDGAKGWFSGMRILELNPDGILQDITPVGGDVGPTAFDDITGDGVAELYDAFYFFVPTTEMVGVAVQRLDQWWAWDSTGYRTLAVQVPAFLQFEGFRLPSVLDSGTRIDEYLDGLSPEQVCMAVAQETEGGIGGYTSLRWYLFEILMYYDAWGDLNAGWNRIDAVLRTAQTCADSDGKQIFLNAINQFSAYFTERDNRSEQGLRVR